MPLRLAGLSGQAPQPRQQCAGGAGLDGEGADRTTIRWAEIMSKSARTGSPIAGHLVDLPEMTAFSSRFDAGDRRRIGEVGAGRSHPRSRRRTEKPRAPSGQPRSRPTPSLPHGRPYRRPRENSVSPEKVGAMPARLRLMAMPQTAATGIPGCRSTWRAARPRVCVPAPPVPGGSRRAGRGARPRP